MNQPFKPQDPPPKPEKECWICHHNDMWWLRQNEWLCGACHPDPNNPEHFKVEIITIKRYTRKIN